MSEVEINFEVVGEPVSQGSHSVINGRIVQVNSAKHRHWRNAVVFAALDKLPPDFTPIDSPVSLSVEFYLSRPKTVTRKTPSVVPDLDKLIRAVGDSLTSAGVISDDARIIEIYAKKLYADRRSPGALVRVIPLLDL